jgi:hypothetical protein
LKFDNKFNRFTDDDTELELDRRSIIGEYARLGMFDSVSSWERNNDMYEISTLYTYPNFMRLTTDWRSCQIFKHNRISSPMISKRSTVSKIKNSISITTYRMRNDAITSKLEVFKLFDKGVE